MTGLRPLLRQAAYRSGMLSLSRSGVRHALTVVMFHRVIDPGDADFAQADPVYTVSAPLFEQLRGFFRDHYAVVDIGHVLDAADGVRKLPEHALLITFDDGWADNLHYAAPLLRARGMPSVIFVAAEAVQADSEHGGRRMCSRWAAPAVWKHGWPAIATASGFLLPLRMARR